MSGTQKRLVVDPTACDGIGMCARLAPDLIRLDRWGYPIVEGAPTQQTAPQATAAVRGCPRRALSLLAVPQRRSA